MLSEASVRRLASKAAESSIARTELRKTHDQKRQSAQERLSRQQDRVGERRKEFRQLQVKIDMQLPGKQYGAKMSAKNMMRFKRGRETSAYLAAKALLEPPNRDWAAVIHLNAREDAEDKRSARELELYHQQLYRNALDLQNKAHQARKDAENQDRVQEGELLKAKIEQEKRESLRQKQKQKILFAEAIRMRQKQEAEFDDKRRKVQARKLEGERKELEKIREAIQLEEAKKLAHKQRLAAERARISKDRMEQTIAREVERKLHIELEQQANRDYEAMMEAKDAQRRQELLDIEKKQQRLADLGKQTQSKVEAKVRAEEERALRERAAFEFKQDTEARAKVIAQHQRKVETLTSIKDQIAQREQSWHAQNKARYEEGLRFAAEFKQAQKDYFRGIVQARQRQLHYRDELFDQAEEDYIRRARDDRGDGTMSKIEQDMNRTLLQRAHRIDREESKLKTANRHLAGRA